MILKKPQLDEAEIVERYSVKLERMSTIAATAGITRQSVWYILHRNGVDTPKVSQMEVSCTLCGKVFKRTKGRVRQTKQPFCTERCYWTWLERGNGNTYIDKSNGRKKAGGLVSKYFNLVPGYIVHHEDRDQGNNNLDNLKVFACAGDHLRYHRGFRVPILFEGSSVSFERAKPPATPLLDIEIPVRIDKKLPDIPWPPTETFIARKCPKCGEWLMTDGVFLWCIKCEYGNKRRKS